jgi:pimeloyl-ACP methyl ester carboxylesterase
MAKRVLWPFLAGAVVGAGGLVLAQALAPRRRLDRRLIKALLGDNEVSPTVLVPGILGSRLFRPNGSEAWLNLGNSFGYHDLTLPLQLPLHESRDELVARGLLGTDNTLPRMFGFTEYADLVQLLEDAGFRRDRNGTSPAYHVFSYDWRRDLVESARALGATLDALAEAAGNPDARFNVIGHSMGGLVARYYLRFGGIEPADDAPVTWAGARRIRSLALVATPNGGSIPALGAVLNGERVGFSQTTLAAPVIERMPSIYQLIPPTGTRALIDRSGEPVPGDLHDPATWERFGWGPFGPQAPNEPRRDFVTATLRRAKAFHDALARSPLTRCPVRVMMLGGDCLPTLARAVVLDTPGLPPRLEPVTRREAEWMFEAGDGRVTRSSVLADHLPAAQETDTGSGVPEAQAVFFADADHHGIYEEPTFQSHLLRLLLRPERPAARPRA